MRLVIDGRWSQERPAGGVGRGIAALAPLLRDRGVDVRLLTDRALGPADTGVPETPLATPPMARAAGWLQLSASQWLHRNRRDVDVFWCPWYGLPYRQPVPMVATLHDLTFEHRPEWFGRGQRAVFRAQARHAARTAAVLFTPSHHVAADVRATYGVSADRIAVTPNAADPCFHPGAVTRLALPDSYVVALGGASRRRLDLAVAAWRAAGEPVRLVVLGEGPPDAVSLSRIPDADWAGVLAGARALLYPTEDEGFGMPALEALVSGTPVVCARVGALPEVLGNRASWAASLAPADLAEALHRALAAGKDAVPVPDAPPTWAATADAILGALQAHVHPARAGG